MDLNAMLNGKEAAAAAAAQQGSNFSLRDQLHSSLHARSPSETGSDRSSVYSGPAMSMKDSLGGYPSPPPMNLSTSSLPGEAPTSNPVKSFACSTCGKGFARRSDLARHERIHSGIRPHVCDYPGCKKEFIQRSALTVHSRVHTGEKPHMCETCGKPFSDSSSLARHRRIHSGKRPYKCPYADCQKTFTRRTTLTRHQNHHTGTVDEAAAATAAALASRSHNKGRNRSPGTASGDSPYSTPSPQSRHVSMSPAASGDLPSMSSMHRQSGEFANMWQPPLPPHMRGDLPHSPRSPPIGALNLPALHPPTSHPTSYPPPILEPQPTSISRPPSEHGSNSGWNSPIPQAMSPLPSHPQSMSPLPALSQAMSPLPNIPYAEQQHPVYENAYQTQQYNSPMYYQQPSNIRRPGEGQTQYDRDRMQNGYPMQGAVGVPGSV